MKKTILISIFILICLISSCTATEKDTDTNKDTTNSAIIMEDLYFFRTYDGGSLVFGSGESRIPVKINPVSQTVSYICLDPLCSHDEGSDCVLYGCRSFYVAGNYLVYIKEHTNWDLLVPDQDIKIDRNAFSFELGVYDMTNGKARKLAEYPDGMSIAGGAGNYIYYFMSRYNEENDSSDFVFYRADTTGGEIIELPMYGEYSAGGMIVMNHPDFHMVIGDKIYWSLLESNRLNYYTTDLAGENKEPLDYAANNYLFGMVYDDESCCYRHGHERRLVSLKKIQRGIWRYQGGAKRHRRDVAQGDHRGDAADR